MNETTKTETTPELEASELNNLVMRQELSDFFFSDAHSEEETNAFIDRLLEYGMDDSVEYCVSEHVIGWATSEPGETAGYHAEQVRTLLKACDA